MAVQQMSSPPRLRSADPTPREMIASARSGPAHGRGTLWLCLATAGLMWAAFTPLGFAPLGWICLVPLLVLVRIQKPTRRMYSTIYLGGLAFWLPSLQWMRLGDPSMYFAWGALALYLAAYFPIFVALCRGAVHRLRIPMMLAVPLAWTGLEFLRNHLLTGFGWYALGHSQYRWIDLIQISDLVGAYGVSFIMTLVAAAYVELLPASWLAKLKLLPLTGGDEAIEHDTPRTRGGQLLRVAVTIALVAGVLGYGQWRRSTTPFTPGPRVAAVQGNFKASLGPQQADAVEVFQKYRQLTGLAVRQQPDLILWPETMFRWQHFVRPANMTDDQLAAATPLIPEIRWKEPMVRQTLTEMSQMCGAALVIGIETITADQTGMQFYNSAQFITPERGMAERYDKLHRVPFGEYVPYAQYLPGAGPYRGQLGLTKGKYASVFEYKGIRYAPVICFEDTVPHLVRGIVSASRKSDPQGRDVDVLLNLSNDGWFQGSSELDQHLITAAFRCVECRTPMVRAVNTGNSALIDGDGVIRAKATDPETKRSKSADAVLVEHVPLDARTSLYVTYGDWFGGTCAVCCGVFCLGMFRRAKVSGGLPR